MHKYRVIIKGRDQRVYTVEGVPDLVGQVLSVIGANKGSCTYEGGKKVEMRFVMPSDEEIYAIAIRQTLGEVRQVSD